MSRNCYREPSPARDAAARLMAETLHAPDGRPTSPRTTAADYAFELEAWATDYPANAALNLYPSTPYNAWRNAAAEEGALYAEAIRGARAMRAAMVARADHQITCLSGLSGTYWHATEGRAIVLAVLNSPRANPDERERGIPVNAR